MSEFVRYERRDRIVTLTLDNPRERNAIGSVAACDDLVAAVERANADAGVSVLILTGAGSAFCSGGNLRRMLDRSDFTRGAAPIDTRDNYRKGIQRIPLALTRVEIPTIAAVNGPAIGLGCDLACLCDIRVAADTASFAESFLKVGLIPGDGGAWILPRVIGRSRAAEMTFTGDVLDATQALGYGLVSRVVPAADLMTSVNALADRIAANPPRALRLAKRLLRESEHSRLADMLELSAAFQALCQETRDHEEAVTAALEKRNPRFEGR